MNQEQKESLVRRYNELRKKMTSRELLDSVAEIGLISLYIVKLKEATLDDDLEKIKDYMTWYKYFSKIGIEDPYIDGLKWEFYDSMYQRYNVNDENKKLFFRDNIIDVHNKIKKYMKKKNK